MKTLYLDCAMGAAGDMLTAALLEVMPDKDAAEALFSFYGNEADIENPRGYTVELLPTTSMK